MHNPMLHASDGSGRINLEITLEDALSGSHAGDCEEDVRFLLSLPYLKSQVAEWGVDDMVVHLLEAGAWEEAELREDEDMTRVRTLWLLCGDAVENAREDARDALLRSDGTDVL